MKCPHCSKEIHFEEEDQIEYNYDSNDSRITDEINGFIISWGYCPSCNNLIIFKTNGSFYKNKKDTKFDEYGPNEFLFPKSCYRIIANEVPKNYRNDFEEATSVLNLSPKASAALSRRLLQKILREKLNISKTSLSAEIDEFMKVKDVPLLLIESVDAIRNIGNFAAHPLKDTNTGEIVDVEPGEADWLLDVIEVLFNYIFVQPEKLKQMKDKLNNKLIKLGKPKMK